MKKLIAVVLIIVSAALVFFAGKGNYEDVDKLEQGEWVLAMMETNGQLVPVDPKASVKLAFRAGKAIWKMPQPDGEKEMEGVYQFNPTTTPKEIDISEPSKTDRLAHGIYKVDGDRLTLCIGPERPKSFTSRGSSLLVFKRL